MVFCSGENFFKKSYFIFYPKRKLNHNRKVSHHQLEVRSKIGSQDLLLLISEKNYIFTSCYSLSDRGMTNVGGKVISQSLTHGLAKRLDSSKKLHIWRKRLCISRVICWSVPGLNLDDHHDNCEPRRIFGSGGTEIITHHKNGVLLLIRPSGPKATRLHLFPLWSLFFF